MTIDKLFRKLKCFIGIHDYRILIDHVTLGETFTGLRSYSNYTSHWRRKKCSRCKMWGNLHELAGAENDHR